MRFESKEQREELIKEHEIKCKRLEQEKKDAKGTDPNYNCKVTLDHRSEYDNIEKDENGVILSCDGDIYFFIIRQPTLVDTIKILEGTKPPLGSVYNSSLIAFEKMIDKKESSPEVFTDRIKLGYLLKMINHIDALTEDQKKS